MDNLSVGIFKTNKISSPKGDMNGNFFGKIKS
jgi:hypothetical protein